MAAPDFVPVSPTARVRKYTSPPRRNRSWTGGRPGELSSPGQPEGDQLGSMGPDQGYAYKLVHLFDDKISIGSLHKRDVTAGCVAVAMKRSALFGRAPVVHDLTAAYTVFGFLDENAPEALVALREKLFPEVHSSHHYGERRELVDTVPADVLKQSHGAITTLHTSDWRDCLTT